MKQIGKRHTGLVSRHRRFRWKWLERMLSSAPFTLSAIRSSSSATNTFLRKIAAAWGGRACTVRLRPPNLVFPTSLSRGPIPRRCVARRFVLDVHQIWLTNLDHLEDGNVGRRLRHARIDTRAIADVGSQIQSVAIAMTRCANQTLGLAPGVISRGAAPTLAPPATSPVTSSTAQNCDFFYDNKKSFVPQVHSLFDERTRPRLCRATYTSITSPAHKMGF